MRVLPVETQYPFLWTVSVEHWVTVGFPCQNRNPETRSDHCSIDLASDFYTFATDSDCRNSWVRP